MWIKSACLPCWPPYSQQVLHQRWIWGSHRQESIQGMHHDFEIQGKHHQKSQTGVSVVPQKGLVFLNKQALTYFNYCLFYRFNKENYEYQNIHRRDTVIGEIYRHLLNDDVIADINKRPSLFEMSWWQQKSCKTFPKGTWDCAAQKTRFLELNQTYHFHPGWCGCGMLQDTSVNFVCVCFLRTDIRFVRTDIRSDIRWGWGGGRGSAGVAWYQLLMLSPNLLIPHTNITFCNENMPCCANIILRCKYHSKFFLLCNFLFGVIEVWSISSFGLNMKSW